MSISVGGIRHVSPVSCRLKRADLLKTGPGILELSNATGNTYSGNTIVAGGTCGEQYERSGTAPVP